jgi:hypothetical protein
MMPSQLHSLCGVTYENDSEQWIGKDVEESCYTYFKVQSQHVKDTTKNTEETYN